jgi:thiol-disulfide isomerase/thioredoxin
MRARSTTTTLLLLALAGGCTRRTNETARTDAASRRTFGAKTNVAHLFRIDARLLSELVRAERKPLTIVNIWATWCGPCREELPMLAGVAKAYAARGVAVLPVSVDDATDEALIVPMLSGLGFSPPFYVVAGDLETFKRAVYGGWRGNIPVSFVLDAQAKRRYYFNAEVFENELTPVLDKLLAGTNTETESHFKVAPGATF